MQFWLSSMLNSHIWKKSFSVQQNFVMLRSFLSTTCYPFLLFEIQIFLTLTHDFCASFEKSTQMVKRFSSFVYLQKMAVARIKMFLLNNSFLHFDFYCRIYDNVSWRLHCNKSCNKNPTDVISFHAIIPSISIAFFAKISFYTLLNVLRLRYCAKNFISLWSRIITHLGKL